MDRSCGESNDNYCELRGELIAEIMSRIKGKDDGHGSNINVRLGYVEFGDMNEVYPRVDLGHAYNTGPVTRGDIKQYYNDIRGYGCKPRDGQPLGQTDLKTAIKAASNQLKVNGKANKIKKIVVFSNCTSDTDICGQDLKDTINGDQSAGEMDQDVVFVNLGDPQITR